MIEFIGFIIAIFFLIGFFMMVENVKKIKKEMEESNKINRSLYNLIDEDIRSRTINKL